MLTAIPKHWFSWDFTLMDEGGSVAGIDIATWGEKGSLEVSGKTYRVFREGFMSGAFVLEANGVAVARAEKPSAMTRRLLIEAGADRFELKPRSLMSRSFQLMEADAVVGTLARGGFLSRRMDVDLPESLALPIKAFVVWLAVLFWRRDANSAG